MVLAIVLLLLGSLAIGLGFGEWFFRLFLKAMPTGSSSTFNEGAAHIAFLAYGALAGVIIFVWATFAASVARLSEGGPPSPPAPPVS